MRIRIFWFALLLIPWHPIKGQSTWRVDTVEVVAHSLQQLAPGHRLVALDSLTLQRFAGQSLAEILAQESDVFIKQYGVNGLATTSIRGAGASHTAILWNGFALPSPMNGQMDLSLLSISIFDQVQIQYGGSSALFGSGAIGGAIHLESQTMFDQGNRLAAHAQLGSFGQWQLGGDVQVSRKRWLMRTRIFHHQAENNFPLVNAYGDWSPRRSRQVHAATDQQTLMQEQAWKLNERQTLRTWVWLQQTNRQLPPTLSQDSSQARQEDRSLRVAAMWTRQGDTWDLTWRSGWFGDRLLYEDPQANLISPNQSGTMINMGESNWRLGNGHTVQMGLQQQWQRGQAQGYGEIEPEFWQLAGLIAYRYATPTGRWQSSVSLRQEWGSGRWAPLLPQADVRARLLPWLSVHGQAGRSFRFPTFNDRFWRPGGNPDLLPEQGWGAELGVSAQGSGTWLGPFQWGLTAFRQLIDQWILWRPDPSLGIWAPENVQTVLSQGLENQLGYHWQAAAWMLQAKASHSFTQSIVAATQPSLAQGLGNQLIYTPRHQGQIGLTVERGSVLFHYQHAFTGRRYTSPDQQAFLPAFDLGNLSLGMKLPIAQGQLRLSARIDNLWAEAYQVMPNRPMPLRRFGLGVVYMSQP